MSTNITIYLVTISTAAKDATPTMLGLTLDCESRQFSWFLTWIVLNLSMSGAPHSFHTLSRLSSYIYNVFQHLLLQLAIIRMQSQLVSQSQWQS
jgi:hypothetical protein